MVGVSILLKAVIVPLIAGDIFGEARNMPLLVWDATNPIANSSTILFGLYLGFSHLSYAVLYKTDDSEIRIT